MLKRTGLKSGVMIVRATGTEDWHHDWSWPTPEKQSSEWHDDEGSYLVCGVAGSNPNPKQQNHDKAKLMIDSGRRALLVV